MTRPPPQHLLPLGPAYPSWPHLCLVDCYVVFSQAHDDAKSVILCVGKDGGLQLETTHPHGGTVNELLQWVLQGQYTSQIRKGELGPS
jgi:hypothetical protein